ELLCSTPRTARPFCVGDEVPALHNAALGGRRTELGRANRGACEGGEATLGRRLSRGREQVVSNKREPLSDATRNDTRATAGARSSTFVPDRGRPAVSPAFNNGRYQGAWDDDEQPF